MAASADCTAAAYQRVNDRLGPFVPEATPAMQIGNGRPAAPPHGCFEPTLTDAALSMNVGNVDGSVN